MPKNVDVMELKDQVNKINNDILDNQHLIRQAQDQINEAKMELVHLACDLGWFDCLTFNLQAFRRRAKQYRKD